MAEPVQYVIHGAGGIGCVVAARLAASGRSVGLIARGAHLQALQEHGLRVVGKTEFQGVLPAVVRPQDLELAEDAVVILAMKSQDTASALDVAAETYAGRPVFCFQNGVANEDLVASRGLRAYGCRVVLGGRILEPGVVAHTSNGILTLGCWPEGIDDVCRRVAADIDASGLEAPLHEQVRAAKWGKVLANVNNAYLALTDTSLQESRRYEEHRAFIADVQEESLAILDAAGITVDVGRSMTIGEQIAKLREPGEWTHVAIPTDPDELGRPSTWQDLHFQRGSVEVEFFNGEIVKLAESLGRQAPLNEALWRRCEDAASRRLAPGSETSVSLRSAAELTRDCHRQSD